MKMMKTQPPKIENQAAYERVLAAVKRMAAEKEKERKTELNDIRTILIYSKLSLNLDN